MCHAVPFKTQMHQTARVASTAKKKKKKLVQESYGFMQVQKNSFPPSLNVLSYTFASSDAPFSHLSYPFLITHSPAFGHQK